MSYKHIAVAVSNSEEDRILVEKSLSVARSGNSSLTLIHVDNDLSQLFPGIYDKNIRELLETLESTKLAHLHQLVKDTGWAETRLRIESGPVHDALLNAVALCGCDLLVCGHHHAFLNRLMPVWRSMVNKIRADLLVVPLADN